MNNTITFPKQVCYRLYGIERDGRVIVEKLNTQTRFTVYAEAVVLEPALINKFSEQDIEWLYNIIESNGIMDINTLSQLRNKTLQSNQLKDNSHENTNVFITHVI